MGKIDDFFSERQISFNIFYVLSNLQGGSVQSLQAISVGYDFGAKVIENDRMMHVQRSSPSVVWLLPSDNFWKPNEVLANTKTKNYTMQDIDEFFQ